MEVLEAIFTRRSIRKYTGEKVEEKKIEQLLRAAMYAPSAVNKQPWHFVVTDRKDVFEAVMGIHPHSKMLAGASHAILVCGDLMREHGPGYWLVDCGAATQNLLLAAHGLGLGAVWLGVHPRQDRKDGLRKLFRLPAHIEPFALISLGYPAEQRDTEERFDPGKIHRDQW